MQRGVPMVSRRMKLNRNMKKDSVHENTANRSGLGESYKNTSFEKVLFKAFKLTKKHFYNRVREMLSQLFVCRGLD